MLPRHVRAGVCLSLLHSDLGDRVLLVLEVSRKQTEGRLLMLFGADGE